MRIKGKKYILLLQETPKTKRMDDAGDARRPVKKPRRESSTSNSNRIGSISPMLNHSTPPRKSGSTLLDRPANIARPVSSHTDIFTDFILKQLTRSMRSRIKLV